MLEFTFSWNYRLSKNLCTMVFWEHSEVAKLLIKRQAFGGAVGKSPTTTLDQPEAKLSSSAPLLLSPVCSRLDKTPGPLPAFP